MEYVWIAYKGKVLLAKKHPNGARVCVNTIEEGCLDEDEYTELPDKIEAPKMPLDGGYYWVQDNKLEVWMVACYNSHRNLFFLPGTEEEYHLNDFKEVDHNPIKMPEC